MGRLLGRGGFGAVYAATRLSDGAALAVKIARSDEPSAAERLLREVEALRAVGPPWAPEVHGTGALADGSPYVILDYLAPPTLAERLAALPGPMPREELEACALDLCAAAAAVHARGLVHRDLKPENVFLGSAHRAVKLVDFGLVKDTARAAPTALTADAPVLGTADYMAPEQCEAHSVIDARADVYALGVILHEMLTGRPPFFGSSSDVREAHLGRRPPRPSTLAPVSPDLEGVVLRALAKDRRRRFPDAAALRDALVDAFARDAALQGDALQGDALQGDAPRARSLDAPPGAAPRTRALVALLFFRTAADAGTVQAAVASCGGQLGSVAGDRFVAVFDRQGGENPADRAGIAARSLVARGIAARAAVDLATVSRRARPDGSVRFMSPLFAQDDRFPVDSDPAGALWTRAAADALPELAVTPVPGREGLLFTHDPPSAGESAGLAEALALETTEGRPHDPPLVGRDEQLEALLASARSTLSGKTALATVIAEPGHGKTLLCRALSEALRSLPSPPRVLELRAREPASGELGQTLRALLQRALELPDAPPEDHGRGLFFARLGPELGEQAWAPLALGLGWLAPSAPALGRLGAAPGALRSITMRAAGEALRRLAAAEPLAVLLDDAHFADDTTLDALEYAALAEFEAPLWICALARPAFEEARPSWGERAGRHDALRLGPLAPDAAAELCRRLLEPAENVPREAILHLCERAQGIPRWLAELVRGLKAAGAVRRHAGVESHYLATDTIERLPDSPAVEWLAGREIASLPPELGAHARLVSLLGGDFTEAEVEGVIAELEREGSAADLPLDAGVGVRRLIARGLLVRGQRGLIAFRYSLLRDAVARSADADLRARVHRAALAFHQGRGARPGAQALPRLAFHAAESGLAETAAGLYLELADRARARHAYLEAERSYSRALDLLGAEPTGDARRLIGRRGRGLMRYRLGRHDDALDDFTSARALARELGDRTAAIEILLDHATALDWSGQYEPSRALVEEAQALAQGARTPPIEARLLMGEGRAHFRAGRLASAIATLEEAAAHAERLGDEGYETRVAALLMLEFALPKEGRFDEADRVAAQVITLSEARGDRLHLAAALNNRYALALARSDVAGATADLLRAAQIGRELGVIAIEYFSAYALGELLYLAGDIEAAWPHVLRAVAFEERPRGIHGRPSCQLLKARVLAFQGRDEEARAALARLEQLQAQARAEGRASRLFIPWEQVFFVLCDVVTRESTPAEREAELELSRRDSVDPDPIEVLELLGLHALRRGRREEARRLLLEAIDRAGRIPNVMGDRLRADLAAAGSAPGAP